jgi:hypothetical protein
VRISRDAARAQRVLDLVPEVPALTWGRDELGAGDMWNSNSLISWLLARSGHDVDRVELPPRGRAPGWRAGLVLADQQWRHSVNVGSGQVRQKPCVTTVPNVRRET